MKRLGLSEKICDRLVAVGVIPEAEKDVYRYGFSQLFTMALNLVSAAVIGVMMGMVWQCFLFLTAYIPLRRFVGGIHAATSARCYFCSVFLLLFILRLIAIAPAYRLLPLLCAAVGAVSLWFLAPVADPNKPFTPAEAKHFRRVSRRLVLAETVLCVFLWGLGLQTASFCVALVLLLLSAMDALGLAKNVYLNRKTKSFLSL